jgi:hypothetical protein
VIRLKVDPEAIRRVLKQYGPPSRADLRRTAKAILAHARRTPSTAPKQEGRLRKSIPYLLGLWEERRRARLR